MDKEIKEGPRAPQIHFIIPPEYMEAMNTMQALAVRHPHIAQEKPIIHSIEEFEVAKDYLGFTKQYYLLVFAGTVYGPTGNDIKTRCLQDCEHILKGLRSYVEALQGPSCHAFRSQQDDKSLEHEIYEILYKTAQTHLMRLTAQVFSPNLRNDSLTINDHVREIKKIRKQVSGSKEFRKKVQEAILEAQENVPALVPLFNPHVQQKPSHSTKQKNGRIEKQRTVNYYKKISKMVPDFSHDVESFDCHFATNSMNILTDYLSLSVKKMPLEEYDTCLQNLTDKCISLESKGISFKTFLLGQNQAAQSTVLSSEELTDLYKFFCQRYTLPQKTPLELLEASILMFIQANKVEEALNRIEALKSFLLERGPLPDHFLTLRASVMALNGNSEEWRKILEEKKTKAQQAKAIAEQRHVNQIKQRQEKAKKEQEEAEKLKNTPITVPEKKRKEIASKSSDNFTETGFIEEDPKVEPPLIPRTKIKTRKAPQEPATNDTTPQKDARAENPTPKAQPLKDYPVSKNAFKTYGKIRRGDWKFSHNDLSNLFRNLKCRVDFSQGKGCHSMIHPPLDMMIMDGDELVAVIPEFISTELPFPITAPDWDAKWSGIVPYYMRKGIINALDYLGATDGTVHK